MLFWALLAAGQITMRKVDGWQTLTHKLVDEPMTSLPNPISLLGRRLPNQNSNTNCDGTTMPPLSFTVLG
jgi:hypothetical protein